MLQVRVSIVRETKPSPTPAENGRTQPPRWRRLAALSSVLAVVGVALVASAGAAPTTDTTAVAFVDITPRQIWANNSISPNRAESVAVIDGTTTVPSNATTVRLAVTVRGAAAGTIKLYPAANEAGGAGHTVSWVAGGTTTATTAEKVGLANKITVFNTSTKAAVVTIKITGYSTQVTAGDINGSGGSAGQVLTNNGAGGATWKSLTAGDVSGLPNNAYRSGAITAVPGAAYVTVASLPVPAGSYAVTFTGEYEALGGGPSTVNCSLVSPGGQLMTRTRGTAQSAFQSESLALVGLGKTTGGTFRVECRSQQGISGNVYDGSFVAVQVGTANGSVSTAKPVARGR